MMDPPSSNELHLQVVVFTNIIVEKTIEYNDFCHNHQPPIAFIKAEIQGVFGSVFCDFRLEFSVFNVNGKEPHKHHCFYYLRQSCSCVLCG